MKYQQAKPLIDKLIHIAVLYHASPGLLREKMFKEIDEFLPTLDAGCLERGCPAYDERDEQ
jgi:hypothetical protein